MTKPEKKRFKFKSTKDLVLDSKGKDVSSLQTMLASYGYLRGAYNAGKMCPLTQRAVRRIQRFYGLKVDGVVGPITKGLLEMPRCGVPDLPTSPTGATPSAPFVLRGCSYNKNALTYAFINGTNDLVANREQEIVIQAFQAWEAVANLSFTEVAPGDNPDFSIAWRSGDHGDGSPFDHTGGPEGNTLAHAFFPPPCGGPNAGEMHFDEAETWIDDPNANGILLLQVAIHEIGHLLGLSHSNDESAIMFAFYAPDRVNLAQDDIQGITTLYGERTDDRVLPLENSVAGSLSGGGDEVTYSLTMPSTLSITLDGPSDADFDLYVRKGERPTVENWDFRAFTASADEKILIPAEPGAEYFAMVRSYNGKGEYSLKLESV